MGEETRPLNYVDRLAKLAEETEQYSRELQEAATASPGHRSVRSKRSVSAERLGRGVPAGETLLDAMSAQREALDRSALPSEAGARADRAEPDGSALDPEPRGRAQSVPRSPAPRAEPRGGTPLGRLRRRVAAFTGVLERLHLEQEAPIPEAGGLASAAPELRAQLGDVIAQRQRLESQIRSLQRSFASEDDRAAEDASTTSRVSERSGTSRGAPRGVEPPERPITPTSQPVPTFASRFDAAVNSNVDERLERADTSTSAPIASPTQAQADELTAVVAERDRVVVLLRCCQDALEKLSSENVALAEDLVRSARASRDAEDLREKLAHTERELDAARRQLRQRTHAANKTILEMAQRNYELQAQRQEARELAADLGSSPRGRDYSASPDREPSPVHPPHRQRRESSGHAAQHPGGSGARSEGRRSLRTPGRAGVTGYEARERTPTTRSTTRYSRRRFSPNDDSPETRVLLRDSRRGSDASLRRPRPDDWLESRLRSVRSETAKQRVYALNHT